MPQAAVHSAAAMLSEARGLLLRGWCLGAQARDKAGGIVPAWSKDASSWSVLGALLASWYHYNEDLNEDFVAHSVDARALGDATEALGQVTGTAALDQWNDAPGRSVAEVVATVDRALELIESDYVRVWLDYAGNASANRDDENQDESGDETSRRETDRNP